MSTPFIPGSGAHVEALRALKLTAGEAIDYQADPVGAWATQPHPERQVLLVSGGGAGHEPMHAGFLGQGGLDVAVPGEIFTSPHNRQIVDSVERAGRADQDVLLIVKNYTGDVINFAIAAERLTAAGRTVETVLVDDDLGSEGADVGRRGTGATVIVEKILGAAADTGLGLAELAELGRSVVARSRSIAVARDAHTRPGGGPGFEVETAKLEYGVGIHGEVAASTIDAPDTAALVHRMVTDLIAAIGTAEHGYIALVNGLGGVSNLELAHLGALVNDSVQQHASTVGSLAIGTYISALDMRGFSITLTAAEPDWLTYWTADHHTVGLPRPVRSTGDAAQQGAADDQQLVGASSPWLQELTERFASYRNPLNRLDQRSGDGDLGTNVAEGVSKAAASGAEGLNEELDALAAAFLNDVGGSSGPLFGVVLAEIARAAHEGTSPESLGRGVQEGLQALQRVGGAEPGDRTMVDALEPAARRGVLDAEAVQAAVDGARSTGTLTARRGRASYLGEKVLGSPDPGAVAAALLLHAVAERSGADVSAVDVESLIQDQ